MMRIARSLTMLWMPALYSMSGCAQIIGIEDLPAILDGSPEPQPDADPLRPDARPTDAGIGSPDGREPDAGRPPDGCEEWTPRPTHFDPCDLPAPSAALNLALVGTYVYDTDAGTLSNPAGLEVPHASVVLPGTPQVRAISVAGLQVGNVSRLRVVGDLPLLVASWSTINVEGAIDVGSTDTANGAGANTGPCNAALPGEQNSGGGGGGGGGGFQGKGGNGGDGSDSGNNGGVQGTGVATPETVRGGCAGAPGGNGSGGGGGVGGAGGGALQLTARASIVIEGTLHAGGSGGGGGNGSAGSRGGGGGGGSGGLIDLEAPQISFGPNAIVAANGGGGGEGTQTTRARAGENGEESDVRAQGGSGLSDGGGDGGDGSAGSARDGTNGSYGTRESGEESGGGGGGGGAGYIILDGDDTVPSGAVLSPAPVRR